jgi:hypothetical protein
MGGALLRRTLLLSGSLDEMQCALAELRARNAELEARIVWRTSQLQAANVAGTRKDELLVAERAARAGAERAERRSTFLAEASRVLASTEEENTPAIVARLAVRHVAEWCLAHAVDQSGSFRRVETACADGVAEANREPHDGLIGMQAGQSGSPPGITTAFAPEALDSLVEALTRDPEHPRILGELGDRSMMVVLLQARGRSTGALAFVAPAPGPCYDLEDLLLAEDLAGRAALVSENARLHRQREEIARTLQQSMLPPRLPDIPGLELASTYCPVGDGIEVGGDFYDLFATGDQCWGIVMGDVSGQGSGAAAIALLARYTVRALAVAERQPSRILTLLNGVMLQHLEGQQHSDERFCTVAYARLEPTALLLRGDGTVEEDPAIASARRDFGRFSDPAWGSAPVVWRIGSNAPSKSSRAVLSTTTWRSWSAALSRSDPTRTMSKSKGRSMANHARPRRCTTVHRHASRRSRRLPELANVIQRGAARIELDPGPG